MGKVICISLCVLCVLFVTPWVLCLIDHIFKTQYSCKVFGWHNGKGKKSFDGCSVNSICSKCGKSVMQDGQGNWF